VPAATVARLVQMTLRQRAVAGLAGTLQVQVSEYGAGNSVALRLKELETLERVAERIDKISVFGGLDQVLNGLVKLR
jgi:hypothetical protein